MKRGGIAASTASAIAASVSSSRKAKTRQSWLALERGELRGVEALVAEVRADEGDRRPLAHGGHAALRTSASAATG